MDQFLILLSSYSYLLSIPLLILSLVLAFKLVSAILRVISLLICLFMIAISWMFFVEPNIINIKEINIPMGINTKLVFVSDLHFSKLKNTNFATQVANKINTLDNVDMVLWGGDWAENLTNQELESPIRQIGTIKFPQYTVLGNHDFQYKKSSKPKTIQEPTEFSLQLIKSLESNGIKVIDNESISMPDIELIGISSQATTYSTIPTSTDNKNRVYLTHEADTIGKLPKNNNQITLAGHSHCGQIKIPVLSQIAYNNYGNHKSKYFEGLYDVKDQGKLFLSCGLGETILPLRLLNPPTIYKINFN